MQGKTHLAAGALAGLLLARCDGAPPVYSALYAGIGGLAGLVPDWLQINIPGASAQIKGAFGHRGFSHWVWTALAAAFGGLSIAPHGLVGAFLGGWLSHILLDTLASGAPAFWPLGRLTLAHVKTGGRIDTFIGAAAVVLAVAVTITMGR